MQNAQSAEVPVSRATLPHLPAVQVGAERTLSGGSMKVKDLKANHVRAALQSAIGRGLKFPSIELEEYVALFLSGLVEVEHAN